MKNQIKKVLSLVLVFAMCLSTLVIGVSADTTCTEAHDGKGETQKYYGWQEPTCEDMGGDKYKCTVCNVAYALNTVAPLGHNVATWTVVAPTCTEAGYTWGTCLNGAKCSETDAIVKKDTVVATGHNLVTKEGDCKIKVCTKCDYTEASDADHKWVAQEAIHTAPSCEGTGIMPYACECGATKEVVINAYGHDYVEVPAVNPTTCTETGTMAHYKCSDCGQLATKKSDGTYEKTTADKLVIAAGHLSVKEGQATITGCVKTTPKYCDLCKEDLEPKVEDAHVFIEDNKAEATCTTWGYIYFTCEKCGYVDNEKTVTIAPTGHSFQELKDGEWVIKEGATVLGTIDATCLAGGATVYACTNAGCRESIDHELTNGETVKGVAIENLPALGHDWKEVQALVPAACGKAGTTSKEECENCDETRGGNEIPALTHNYVEKVYAVTCVKDGYTCEECTYCGDVKADSTKDVVKADGTAHEYIDVLVKDPVTYNKCENPGYWVKVCKFCGDEDDEKRYEQTSEHDWKELYVVPGDCTSEAIHRFECANCGKAENRLGKTDTTAEGHIAAMGEAFETLAPLVVIREPSCTAPGYYTYKCTKCAGTFEIAGEYGHTLVDKSETEVTDCFTGAIGYTGKWCTTCEKWVGVAEGGVEKTPIVHEADTTMAKQDYVCKSEVKGWEAFDYCSICKAKYDVTADDGSVTNAYIDALKAANAIYHAYAKVEAKAATCTADGWNEYCGTCQTATDTGIKLDKLGHDHVKVDFKAVNCGQIGYDHMDCTRCDDEYVTNYKKALEHVWVKGATTDPTCTEKGYTAYTCSTCAATKNDDETAALGHKNAAGETITTACTDTVADRVCVQCDTTIAKEHSYTAADVHQPTCTENGYVISLCDYCGEEKLDNFVAALGHVKSTFVSTKLAPTATTKGIEIWNCAQCGQNLEYETPALGLITMDITADSGVKAGYNIVNGGLVKFEVALDVANLDMALLMAEFKYNADVLEFVGVELAETFFQVKNEAGEVAVIGNMMFGVNDEDGVVTITVDATYTANKIPTNVNVNGEVAFVTLTFRVADDKFNMTDSIEGQITQVANVAEEMIVTNAPVAKAEYAITKLASINADSTIDIIDLLAIRKMAFTDMNGTIDTTEYWLLDDAGAKVEVNYLAEADIDMDGFVTLDDYALLNKFLTTNITYEELVLTSQTNG